MPKTFDLMAPNGSYKDANGQDKTRWLRCGAVFEKDNGNVSLKLDTLPIGKDFDGWFSLFKAEDGANQARPAASAPAGKPPAADDYEDDIPF